jgi:hypothetical protein
VSTDDDLHQAAHHVHHGEFEAAVKRLLKVVVVLSTEVARLKAEHRPHHHQSEPERDVR